MLITALYKVMDDFVAYTSRWRTGLLLVVCIAFVAAGVWMAGIAGPVPVSRRAGPLMTVIWGWITIGFFGMGVVALARAWWKNSELLRIGQLGIRWLPWSDQTIPWSEISDVTEWSYKSSRSIILHIRNPSQFPGKGTVGFFGRANRALTGGDIGFSLAGTNRKFNEALSAIAQFRPTP